MSKPQLTDAERDSHAETMNIHLETAERLIREADFRPAKISLELALVHANAIGNKAIKSKIFSALNRVRSAIRKTETALTSALMRNQAGVST